MTDPKTCIRCGRTKSSHAPDRRDAEDACTRFEAGYQPRVSFEPFAKQTPRIAAWETYDPLQHAAWLVLPDEEWTTAYRLIIRNGEFEVAEVRIYPTDPPDFPFASNGEWLVDRDTVPEGGVTSELLRQPHLSQVRDHIADVLTAMRDEFGDERYQALLGERDLPGDIITRLRSRRRGDLSKAERQQLEAAIRYDRHIKNGTPKPRDAVRKEMHLSSSRVRDLLTECRRKGFLTPTTPGRAGGRLTERALDRIKELGIELEEESDA